MRLYVECDSRLYVAVEDLEDLNLSISSDTIIDGVRNAVERAEHAQDDDVPDAWVDK